VLTSFRRRRHEGGAAGIADVTDTFDRADSATSLGTSDSGHVWTALSGTWGIATNAAYLPTSADNYNAAIVDSGRADCTVQYTASTVDESEGRVPVRMTDSQNGFIGQASGAGVGIHRLYRIEAGAFTELGTYTADHVSGDVLKMVLSGSSIKYFLNGVERIAATDSFQSTAMKHGIGAGTGTPTTHRYNDFSVVA